MSNFDFKNELKKTIQNKQLIQIHFNESPIEFRVGYILGSSDGFFTVAEVNDGAVFDGVSVYREEDIVTLKIDTVYLAELTKRIKDDIYGQALKDLEGIKKFTFDGFIANAEETGKIVAIKIENDEARAGKIVGHDDEVVVFDEYKVESSVRYARAFFKIDVIDWMGIDIPWLRTISQSLADKRP